MLFLSQFCVAFADIYSKCYTSVCDGETNKKAFVVMRVVKERVESWLDVANKKVEDLQS